VISYAARTDNDKDLARSCFVAELERTGKVRSNSCQLESSELEEAMKCFLQELPEDHTDMFTSDLIGERLKDYKLSVSHLNAYLKCPRTFFFENILRVPQPKNAAMAFGTSVHKALEQVFRLMQLSAEQEFPPREDFIARFVREMQRNQDAFTEVEFDRRMKGGVDTLGQFYELNVPLWHKKVLLEKPFQTMLDDAIPLNGLVDKLELFGDKVNLVDYKTGKYNRKKFQPPDPLKVQKALDEKKEPKHEDMHGGDYWRQAVFYKFLVEHNPTNIYQVESTIFCHVEPDDKKEFINQRIEITAEDEELVREQIREVYGKIMQREFGGTCNNEYCEWCGINI
jgi:DNA helicase-2/ATP-dependent DNA helicase PcrA